MLITKQSLYTTSVRSVHMLSTLTICLQLSKDTSHKLPWLLLMQPIFLQLLHTKQKPQCHHFKGKPLADTIVTVEL